MPRPRTDFPDARGADAPLAVADFDYNAWGWKYPPFDLDDNVPLRVAGALGGLPVFHPGIVLEGGSIDVNGAGTCSRRKVACSIPTATRR